MENLQYEEQNEEIVNPEQFQVGRAPEEEKTATEEDTGYTEGEIEYADGQGTQLDEELEDMDSGEIEDEDEFEKDLDESDGQDD